MVKYSLCEVTPNFVLDSFKPNQRDNSEKEECLSYNICGLDFSFNKKIFEKSL